MRRITAAAVVAVFLMVCEATGRVHAYLDPGTGSMVVQVVLGAVVGGLTLARLYWRRIKAFVLRRQPEDPARFDG